MSASSVVLWEMRGRTGKPATCTVQRADALSVVLAISIGEDQIVHESHPDMTVAMTRGREIRNELIAKGWALTYAQDDDPESLGSDSAASRLRGT